jgi:hypothetical protein
MAKKTDFALYKARLESAGYVVLENTGATPTSDLARQTRRDFS